MSFYQMTLNKEEMEFIRTMNLRFTPEDAVDEELSNELDGILNQTQPNQEIKLSQEVGEFIHVLLDYDGNHNREDASLAVSVNNKLILVL